MLKVEKRLSDVPSPATYRWRAHSRLVTLGNYLYIEGGEQSQWVNGQVQGGLNPGPNLSVVAVNSTLLVPIDKSWDSSTVSIKSIPKNGAPVVRIPSLLLQQGTGTIYSWGGAAAAGADASAQHNRQMWKLVTDGQGSGTWSIASTPQNTHRGVDTATTTCNGEGYILGGYGSSSTDDTVTGNEPHPGLTIYDFQSAVWTNISAPAPISSHIRGEADCVPFGKGGLVMFLGGAETPPNSIDPEDMIAMDNLTFYDTVTKKFHWQQATGASSDDIPPPRSHFCSAGVLGPGGTYDIFVYGGYDAHNTVLSDAYILSLPAFRWFHIPASATPRWGHQCAFAGKRQIISVGGLATLDGWTGDPQQDPLPQGFGIFDLSTWSWSTHYNADAATYESPSAVKAWYQNR
ncbi:hypothetical protein GQ53DRAFT_708224 [Thozetella sp. PMI_491]|nr:hypothetical protein GQ53DRAFT_708224 [Thozetella sp. PMI_491]